MYKGKGAWTRPSSYRSISLTVVASKILERLVADQISSYLADNDLICQEQQGFSRQRSTVPNLLQCDAVIAEFLNKDKACDIITIDFSRAFDKMLRRALIDI